ncbi:hypothetical protein ACH4RA_23960 [Streptomyces smyrnaeus]|uniref:hypothetical protein n=1 Tax=Streptomyces TaxID=1883 RepID=UPI000C1974FB|nr:hypothetical protein [Streptomyces sp. B15]MBQ1118952.1 hypothetical protein [Streptomyces sp. B15]MBQ1162184.1 hypothetical protein [Streptomyces sp. A73]
MPARALPRKHPLFVTAVTAATVLTLGALGACSLEEPTTEKARTGKAGSSSSEGKQSGPSADRKKQQKNGGDSGPRAAGESALYADKGLKVTVSAPEPFTPSAYAAGHKSGQQAHKLRVTLENTGDTKIDTVLVTVGARQGEDGETTAGIFDGETVGSGFTGKLLPGKRATATYGFDAPRGAGTLDIEVSVNDFETEPAQWSLKL